MDLTGHDGVSYTDTTVCLTLKCSNKLCIYHMQSVYRGRDRSRGCV